MKTEFLDALVTVLAEIDSGDNPHHGECREVLELKANALCQTQTIRSSWIEYRQDLIEEGHKWHR